MKVQIYQVNPKQGKDLLFLPYREVKSFDLAKYDLVYETKTKDRHGDIDIYLNELFQKFNIKHPRGYNGRSMSTSDVVVIDSKYMFYCDSYGWERIDGKPAEEIEFTVEPGFDLEHIGDSLRYESGQTVAVCRKGNWSAEIRVCGEVRLFYAPNEDTKMLQYRHPLDFPEGLKLLIEEGKLGEYEHVDIGNRNWYELFIYNGQEYVNSEVIDDLDDKPSNIMQWMLDTIEEYKKEEECDNS